MVTAVKIRNTALNKVRESAKKDPSPKWEGSESWTSEQFARRFREALRYYNIEHNGKDLKAKVIDWMSRNGYEKSDISRFKAIKDWRSNVTMGAVAACLLRGMPDSHPEYNKGRKASDWLRQAVNQALVDGVNDIAPVEVKLQKITGPILNIQERIREQAGVMSEEIDVAIDSWIMDPDGFDPKAFKMVSLLRGKGAKAAQARYIKSFFEKGHAELKELSSGDADEQLREAYKHHPRKNIKKLIDFYESIASACEQIAAEAKVLKKPRAKKVKPAEELVKKLKFRVSDDKLGITSVHPAQLVGASGAVFYNCKTRKIGYLISTSSIGFSIKGTSIVNFTEKSSQKTLRNPSLQLKEFKEQNTQKRFETWFAKNIKTTETVLTGRLSEDTVILRVFK